MTVLTEREGPVAVVIINRPQARNAVNPATAALLFAALAEAEQDDRTREGEARSEAISLAQHIARFPQLCLRADRASAYAGWSRDIDDALRAEAQRGMPVLAAESRAGAARFAAGKGRGGDFGEI